MLVEASTAVSTAEATLVGEVAAVSLVAGIWVVAAPVVATLAVRRAASPEEGAD
jgi:hypothetical protein